jgi:hypothetical protein
MAGDDVGSLHRPGQRAVVDGREGHRTQSSTQLVGLLATELRKTAARGVLAGRILFTMTD